MKINLPVLAASWLLVATTALSCGKDDENEITPKCHVSSGYFSFKDSSFVFALPTAFTPNGDGINDVYIPSSTSGNVTDYSLVIYNDQDNSKVFETNSMNLGWNGIGGTGYKYSVMIHFKDEFGSVVDTCSYLYLLSSGPDGCAKFIQADAGNYYFPDQFYAAEGVAAYVTVEKMCF